VVIHEAACSEASCSPIETIIAVLDGSDRTFRFDGPLAEVTPHSLRLLVRQEGSHHDHDR
jgi:hypothetical protein